MSEAAMRMARWLVSPGDLAADLFGLGEGSEHRQILRMFVNTLVWGLVGVFVALWIAL
jgi:hypothetical protein